VNLDTALYHAVHDFGVAELAKQMGIAESTLQNLANPRITTNEWTRKRIKQVFDFTGDLRIAHAAAAEYGGMFLPLVQGSADTDGDIFRHTTTVAKEFGDVVAEVQASMADGVISQTDNERIHQQIYELNRAAHNLGLWIDSQSKGPARPPLAVVKK
jgi:hypothetical protein